MHCVVNRTRHLKKSKVSLKGKEIRKCQQLKCIAFKYHSTTTFLNVKACSSWCASPANSSQTSQVDFHKTVVVRASRTDLQGIWRIQICTGVQHTMSPQLWTNGRYFKTYVQAKFFSSWFVISICSALIKVTVIFKKALQIFKTYIWPPSALLAMKDNWIGKDNQILFKLKT